MSPSPYPAPREPRGYFGLPSKCAGCGAPVMLTFRPYALLDERGRRHECPSPVDEVENPARVWTRDELPKVVEARAHRARTARVRAR